MKEKILKLREEGKTYNEIKSILGCSKSTISYYCGEGQKLKNLQRGQKFRNSNPISNKIEKFRNFEFKVRDFQKDDSFKRKGLEYNTEDVLNKFGENPKCYLTGRSIDINKPSTYHFDHIVPRKKGGTGELSNLGLTTREANFAKSDMTVNEFIELCKDVLINFGYEIGKK